jgi:hypothetical protein
MTKAARLAQGCPPKLHRWVLQGAPRNRLVNYGLALHRLSTKAPPLIWRPPGQGPCSLRPLPRAQPPQNPAQRAKLQGEIAKADRHAFTGQK